MADYYVATTGDDGDAGTIGAPFATLQHGVDQLGAGDTLYVRGGTYTAGFSLNASGTSGNEITIQAYTGETPIIDGGWDGVTFPFTVATWGERYDQQVSIVGDYVICDGIHVQNCTGRGFELVDSANSTLKNCSVTTAFQTPILTNNCTDCLLENCTIAYGSLQRRWRTYTVNGVYVDNHPNVMPLTYCQDCTVRNCTVYNSGGEGIDIFRSTSCLVEGNTVYNCDGVLYYLNWAGDGTILRNNIGFFTDNYEGVGNPRMSVVATGLCLRDEYQSASKQRFGPTRNAEIYNNVILSPTQALWITSYAGMDTNTIEHNTFVAMASGDVVKVFTPVDTITTDWTASIIKNNVFVGPSSISAHSGITWSYNNWKTTPSTRAQGTGDIYSNPLLVDDDAAIATSGAFTETNYLLTASSPGIDQGNGATYTTDFYGVTRSSPDMGFAEYTTEVPPVAVITVPSDPATVGDQQTLSSASSTGAPTAWVWEIDDVQVGTSSTYAWTPASVKSYKIALTVTNAYGSDTATVYVYAYGPSVAGDVVAALITGAVPGSTGSDGGTTHADLSTNTAGVLMAVSGATTAGTPFADAEIGIGGTDGTNHRAIAAAADDNNADSFSGMESQQATAYLVSPQHTMIVDGDAALTDSETITMTWNTVSTGKLYAALRIAATNAAVGDFVPGGAAVNVGFQPDIVFFWTTDENTAFSGTGRVTGNVSFGWVTADGARSLSWRSVTGTTAGNPWAYYSETYCVANIGSTLEDGITATLGATGFSHASTGSMTGKVGYLAIKLDGLGTQIIDIDTETSTGTKSYAADFEAGAAVMLGSLLTAAGSLVSDATASVFSIGFWDGTNERAVAVSDEDAADPTNTASHVANELLLVPADDGTALIDASVDSVTDSTFVLDYTATDTGTARKATLLLIEAPAATVTNYDYFQTGLQAGALAGMP